MRGQHRRAKAIRHVSGERSGVAFPRPLTRIIPCSSCYLSQAASSGWLAVIVGVAGAIGKTKRMLGRWAASQIASASAASFFCRLMNGLT